MAHTGRATERLVAQLQEQMGPEGVNIESPKRFHNGKSWIGEVDIFIEADFGSSRVAIGIECRDRPADGVQGLPWIREAYGKRDQLGLDKVICVSTTGFTEDAVEYADSIGIDLLTLSAPEETDSSYLFKVVDIRWANGTATPVDPVDITTKDKSEPVNATFSSKDSVFISSTDGTAYSLESLISKNIEQIRKDSEGSKDSGPVFRKMRITEPLQLQVDGKCIEIEKIDVTAKVAYETFEARAILNLCTNAGEKRHVGWAGVADMRTAEGWRKFLITATEHGQPTGSMAMKVRMLDENGVPLEFAPGTRFTVYGHE